MTSQALGVRSENGRGILLMVLGMAAFSIEDAFLKVVAERMAAGQVLAILGGLGTLLFAGLALRRGHRAWSRMALHPAVMGRNASEIVGTLSFVAALGAAPLVTVSAIFQAMPLFVTMGAALFLGERVGWRRWTAILVGFGGVMLIVRPWSAAFEPGALLALGAVVGLGARDLFTRRIPSGIDTTLLTTWGFLAVGLAGAGQLLVTGGAVRPSGEETALLAGALLVGAVGYWWLTESTRLGELSAVMPFRYSRLLFGLIVGVAVFGERPDLWTLVGAAIVVGSGVYAFARERARAREAGRVAGLSPRAGAG